MGIRHYFKAQTKVIIDNPQVVVGQLRELAGKYGCSQSYFHTVRAGYRKDLSGPFRLQ